jgi:hypothetical protein
LPAIDWKSVERPDQDRLSRTPFISLNGAKQQALPDLVIDTNGPKRSERRRKSQFCFRGFR